MDEATTQSGVLPVLPPPQSRREIRKLLDRLQDVLPTLYPVILRFRSKHRGLEEGDFGATMECKVRGEKRLLVVVSAELPPPADLLVFWHEYAHARAWLPEHMETDDYHDARWGLALSEVWAIICGEKQ